jgi:hypothetical protein
VENERASVVHLNGLVRLNAFEDAAYRDALRMQFSTLRDILKSTDEDDQLLYQYYPKCNAVRLYYGDNMKLRNVRGCV